MKIVGLVLLFAGLVSLVEGIGAATGGLSWALLASLFPTMGLAAGGLGLLLAGGVMTRRARRFGKYLACAHGQGGGVPEKAGGGGGCVPRKVENDLEIMIEKGPVGRKCLPGPGKRYAVPVPGGGGSLLRQKEAGAGGQEPPQAEQGYSGILRDIRRANDRIADPVLSQKIDRLEEVAGKIFRIIEKEPAKKAKASTFLNYYLPTTQKLLDSYAEFEEAGVSGENLNQAKAKIQSTMDSIVAGFERQLDELYRADAMDIDSDIRVMETMLRRDSATVADDFGLGGGTAVQQEEE